MNAMLSPGSPGRASASSADAPSDTEMAAAVVIPRDELNRLYAETQARQLREARRARRSSTGKTIAILGLLGVVGLQALAAAQLFPLVRVVPVIAVPQPDGSMATVVHGDALPATVQERAVRATLFQYVRLREGWSSGEAQYAYDVVSRMSSPQVRSAFQEWFNLDKAPGPQAVWGTRATVTVEQLSGALLPNDTAQADEIYQLRFRRTERAHGRPPVVSTWVVTLRYRDSQSIAFTDGTTINPLGVLVTEYRPPEREGVPTLGDAR
jgi:type IV secretion system protein VirB8